MYTISPYDLIYCGYFPGLESMQCAGLFETDGAITSMLALPIFPVRLWFHNATVSLA